MRKLIIVIIIILSFTPLLWFKDNLLIAGGDHSFFLDPLSYLNKMYTWSELEGNGLGSVSYKAFTQYLPLVLFYQIFNFYNLSPVTIQKLFFIFMYLLTGLSMHFLYTQSIKKDSLGALAASIFYMFNLCTLFNNPLATGYWLVYASLPLIIALFLKGLKSSNHNKYVILIGFFSLVYSSALSNLAIYFSVFLVIFVTFVSFFIIYKVENKKRPFLFLLKTSLFVLIINLWVIYPRFISAYNIISNGINLLPQGAWATGSTHLYQAFRLLGQWWWSLSHLYRFYANNFFIALSYLFAAVIISVLFYRIKEKNIYFFIFLAITGLFLAKGTNEPLGYLYKWAYYNIPGFIAFRAPYSKFTLLNALSYSVIFGFVIDKTWIFLFFKQRQTHRLLNFKKFTFIFIIIALLLMNVWPIFTNYYIEPGNKNNKSWHIKIPDDWEMASEWLRKQKGDFKTLELPKDNGYGMEFNWQHGFVGINPSYFLFNKPAIGIPYAGGKYSETDSAKLINAVYSLLYKKKTKYLSKILGMLNIKYLHLRTDIEWEKYKFTSPEENRKLMKSDKNIKLVKTMGSQEFYLNEDFLPVIYASSSVKIIGGGISDYKYLSFIEDISMKENPAFVFKDQLNKSHSKILPLLKSQENISPGFDIPKIKFEKINPTKYKIQFTANTPFVLVFGQSFHPDWQAYYENNKAVNEHFVVNGYANGYFIDKVGKHTVILKFIPQKLASVSICISSAVLIVGMLYLIFNFFLKKGKINNKNEF